MKVGNLMGPSFYEYILRYVNHDANDPISRLANRIHSDQSFPKKSESFDEVSTYLESSPEYSKLLVIFDDTWQSYQFDNF